MMHPVRVFKFGGASVKDAPAVRNVASILARFPSDAIVVVVSAMGKTTNALEVIHNLRFKGESFFKEWESIRKFHLGICSELFEGTAAASQVIQPIFDELLHAASQPCSDEFDREYDQIVSFGELISTAIIDAYLRRIGVQSILTDAREIIRTDDRFRDARVLWEESAMRASGLRSFIQPGNRMIIQGFIGSAHAGYTTTLGREGSDFTASVMAYLLDAVDVTIWKDVPGMLNADPRKFPDTVKLDRISFHEAIELAYYGASVIHPKTIKPLQNKAIPLYIKSFIDPDAEGTIIQVNTDYDSLVPSYIVKDNQVLVSLSTRDFSFVVEDNLRDIFDILVQTGVRIHLMENSAISFSMCMDYDEYKQEKLFVQFAARYTIRYNEGLSLVTVRHYDEQTIKKLTSGREVLLEQRSRATVRLVMR
jgi:aspartate kinase